MSKGLSCGKRLLDKKIIVIMIFCIKFSNLFLISEDYAHFPKRY